MKPISRRHNFTIDEKIKLIQIVKKVGIDEDSPVITF
ncbi:MAG: hypothetical protein MHMPM18_004850 [Marteilia pararefringens]